MTFLRPEARDMMTRWSEVAAAAGLIALGLWSLTAGGYFFAPLGLAIAGLGLVWALIAFRRLRFLRPVAAPGMVELVEGQVSYFGPTFGGAVALSDLSELRLVAVQRRLQWLLRSDQGEVLLIPADAAGAERLYDAFASLPGIDMAALTRALARGTSTGPLWTRSAHHRPTIGRS